MTKLVIAFFSLALTCLGQIAIHRGHLIELLPEGSSLPVKSGDIVFKVIATGAGTFVGVHNPTTLRSTYFQFNKGKGFTPVPSLDDAGSALGGEKFYTSIKISSSSMGLNFSTLIPAEGGGSYLGTSWFMPYVGLPQKIVGRGDNLTLQSFSGNRFSAKVEGSYKTATTWDGNETFVPLYYSKVGVNSPREYYWRLFQSSNGTLREVQGAIDDQLPRGFAEGPWVDANNIYLTDVNGSTFRFTVYDRKTKTRKIPFQTGSSLGNGTGVQYFSMHVDAQNTELWPLITTKNSVPVEMSLYRFDVTAGLKLAVRSGDMIDGFGPMGGSQDFKPSFGHGVLSGKLKDGKQVLLSVKDDKGSALMQDGDVVEGQVVILRGSHFETVAGYNCQFPILTFKNDGSMGSMFLLRDPCLTSTSFDAGAGKYRITGFNMNPAGRRVQFLADGGKVVSPQGLSDTSVSFDSKELSGYTTLIMKIDDVVVSNSIKLPQILGEPTGPAEILGFGIFPPVIREGDTAKACLYARNFKSIVLSPVLNLTTTNGCNEFKPAGNGVQTVTLTGYDGSTVTATATVKMVRVDPIGIARVSNPVPGSLGIVEGFGFATAEPSELTVKICDKLGKVLSVDQTQGTGDPNVPTRLYVEIPTDLTVGDVCSVVVERLQPDLQQRIVSNSLEGMKIADRWVVVTNAQNFFNPNRTRVQFGVDKDGIPVYKLDLLQITRKGKTLLGLNGPGLFTPLFPEEEPYKLAEPGDIIDFWSVGLGALNNEGKAIEPLHLQLGGVELPILYAGHAPGLPGVFQIQFRVPNGAVPDRDNGHRNDVLGVGTTPLQFVQKDGSPAGQTFHLWLKNPSEAATARR